MVKSKVKPPYLPLTPEERAFAGKVMRHSVNATLLYYTGDHADRAWIEHQYNLAYVEFKENTMPRTAKAPAKAPATAKRTAKPEPANKPKGGKKAPPKKGGGKGKGC